MSPMLTLTKPPGLTALAYRRTMMRTKFCQPLNPESRSYDLPTECCRDP